LLLLALPPLLLCRVRLLLLLVLLHFKLLLMLDEPQGFR
jgi:hypothetical protein